MRHVIANLVEQRERALPLRGGRARRDRRAVADRVRRDAAAAALQLGEHVARRTVTCACVVVVVSSFVQHWRSSCREIAFLHLVEHVEMVELS